MRVPAPPLRKLFLFQLIVVLGFFSALELGLRLAFPRQATDELLISPRTPGQILSEDSARPPDGRPMPALAAQTACDCASGGTCRLLPPFRERTFSCAPTPGVLRVLFLGESSVYGDLLPTQDTVPAWLERLGQERGLALEVINLGLSGHDLGEIVEVLRAFAPRLSPGLVILYAGHNEIYPLIRQNNTLSYPLASPWTAWAMPVYRRLATVRLAAYWLGDWKLRVQKKRFASEEGYRELEPRRLDVLDEATFAALADLKCGLIGRAQRRLAAFCRSADSVGVPSVFIVPTSSRTMRPLSSTHGPGYARDPAAWEERMRAAERAMEERRWDEAFASLQRAAAIDPHHALTHYLAGMCLLKSGRPVDARPHLDRALEELYVYQGFPALEGAPPSFLSAMGEHARSLGVPVIDGGTALRGGLDPSRDGGDFQDFVHYSYRGARKLAAGILEELLARGILAPAQAARVTDQ